MRNIVAGFLAPIFSTISSTDTPEFGISSVEYWSRYWAIFALTILVSFFSAPDSLDRVKVTGLLASPSSR